MPPMKFYFFYTIEKKKSGASLGALDITADWFGSDARPTLFRKP